MKKLTIAGLGSVLYIKDSEQETYRETILFLRDIYKVSINGEETKYELVEMPELVNYLGYSTGRTQMKWIRKEESEELFDIGVEYLIPDADKYRILIQHTKAGDVLGSVFLIDIVNVNGEDILTSDKVIPFGEPSKEHVL